MKTQDSQLAYYRRELAYLRMQSADFADRHPKVAPYLALNGTESVDPHIEHLIESVAFLSGRIRCEIDRDLPTVAGHLLDQLCPVLTRPLPSMTVMQMTVDPDEGKVTSGSRVAHGTMLSATAFSGVPCRFQAAWNTTLWPLHVDAVTLEDARTLRIDIKGDEGIDVAELEVADLRVHLFGDVLTTMPLHDLLITSLDYIDVISSTGIHRMPPRLLVEAGIGEEETLLTDTVLAHPAYALLQAYFAFPRKFQFFNLSGLRGRLGSGNGFSVRMVFTQGADVLSRVGAGNILLNCVPAINLFQVTSEPIAYDQRRYEYLLVPDRRLDSSTEVHSIVSINTSETGGGRSRPIPTAFSDIGGTGDTEAGRYDASLCWTLRRTASLRPGIVGTDVYLGIVDRRNPAAIPSTRPVIYANLLCTNRQLAAQVTPGTRFYGDGIPASTDIRALYQPTAQRPPKMDNESLWALVSLLRLNHNSLVEGSAGVTALRELLTLFAGDSARDAVQIRGIRSMTARPAMARLRTGAGAGSWRGHCRGTDIELEFDPDAFAGASPLMLAGVLARFFALYTTANSFVRLRVLRSGETWMEWPPMTGRQALL